jgi:hypothetical protein
MVGSGNMMDPYPWTRNQGPIRPALSDITKGQGDQIKHQCAFIGTVGKYAVCNVSSLDFTLVDAFRGPFGDYAAPDSLLDVSLDSNMTSQHKTLFGNLLKKYLGLNNSQANAVVNSVTTYRQAFDYLCAQVQAGMTIDKIRAVGV